MSSPIPASLSDPESLRGWAARKMLAEDARWAMDVILSAREVDNLSGFVPLVMGHHFVRIAYEGTLAIRSANPRVGVAELATLLNDNFAAITRRARHLTKLLDDTKKSYAGVLADFAVELRVHHAALTGHSVRFARWLETDLGLYDIDRALIGATVPAAYRLGLHPARTQTILGADLLAVSEEWGGTLVVLSAVDLEMREPTPTLDLSDIRIGYRDRLASRYLPTRFNTQFPAELKALLLLIEGDLNTLRLLLPRTSPGHEGPVFRAQVVTAYHCFSALRQISEAYATEDTKGLRQLRLLLADQRTQRLLSPGGMKVRNRSVHYEMNDSAIVPDIARPMYGIVEAVSPGQTWESLATDLCEVSSRAAEQLAAWNA